MKSSIPYQGWAIFCLLLVISGCKKEDQCSYGTVDLSGEYFFKVKHSVMRMKDTVAIESLVYSHDTVYNGYIEKLGTIGKGLDSTVYRIAFSPSDTIIFYCAYHCDYYYNNLFFYGVKGTQRQMLGMGYYYMYDDADLYYKYDFNFLSDSVGYDEEGTPVGYRISDEVSSGWTYS